MFASVVVIPLSCGEFIYSGRMSGDDRKGIAALTWNESITESADTVIMLEVSSCQKRRKEMHNGIFSPKINGA